MIPAAILAAQIHPQRYAHEAVVCDSKVASKVGAAILSRGGNAVDAAVATGFALAVTLPAAGNIGGGGFMMIRTADGKAIALDYRETAPAASTRTMFVTPEGKLSRDSTRGHRAAGVPGSVAGFWEAHRRYGKLPWKEVVAPAVRLADQGFAVPYGLAISLKNKAKDFAEFPESQRIFCRNGRFYGASEVFRQPELAATLRRIQTQGRKGFYHGKTADLLTKDMKGHGGLITKADLKNYQVRWREPLRGEFHGYTVVTMPPPSSGGIVLLQMLEMVKNDDLKTLGWNSSSYLHLLVEVMKRSFVNRSVFLGDPDFVYIPQGHMLDKGLLAGLRSQIGPRATPAKEIEPIAVDEQGERRETTHFSIVDRNGMAVANTYTLNGSYGSYATVKGAGFLLNNEMDDFTGAPGQPNLFGLIQGEKNAIQPGKRPLSSMTPTFVEKNGKLVLVLGSPGGPTIITTVFQTLLNTLEFEMTIQRSVSSPRFHHQWLPDQIEFEPFGLSADVRAALEVRGHVFEKKPEENGSCHSIQVGPEGLSVGVDPRISSSGADGR